MYYTWAFEYRQIFYYETVKQAMDDIEYFQDRLNNNISSNWDADIFIQVAQKARDTLASKYKDSFTDPARYASIMHLVK